MGRSTRERRPPALPKVERVELNEKHMGLRFAAFALCLALGLTALGFGIWGLLTSEPGWAEIEASSGEAFCAEDITFSYLLGKDATAQRKALTSLYTERCRELSRIFDATQTYEDEPGNLCWLNTHPNEDVQVDPLLYQAIERIGPENDMLYQGLLDAYSLNLSYESQAGPEAEELLEQLEAYAEDRSQIKLELLGSGTVHLTVSPEYAGLAAELDLDVLLDFGWLKNALILDFLAEDLGARGYTQGILSTTDGFTRSLGSSVGPIELSLYKWNGTRAVETGRQELSTPVNAASLTMSGVPETILEHSATEGCTALALKVLEDLRGSAPEPLQP